MRRTGYRCCKNALYAAHHDRLLLEPCVRLLHLGRVRVNPVPNLKIVSNSFVIKDVRELTLSPIYSFASPLFVFSLVLGIQAIDSVFLIHENSFYFRHICNSGFVQLHFENLYSEMSAVCKI